MIKYICNRCKNEISRSGVNQITIQSNESKKTVHLCSVCMRPFTSYLYGGSPDEFILDDKDEPVKDESRGENDQSVVDKPTQPEHSEHTAEGDVVSGATGKVVTFQNVNILCKGASVDEITKFLNDTRFVDNFIDMKPIPVEICEKFFTQEFISFGPRADVLINIRVILMFYRGVALSEIGRKFNIGNKQFLEAKLMNHVSLGVYKRWFSSIPDFGIEKRKVSELLACLVAMSVKDAMIEVGLNNGSLVDEDTVFNIVEYYIGFGLSDLQKQKFLGKV